MNPRLKALQDKLQAQISDFKELRTKDQHTEAEAERYSEYLNGSIDQTKAAIEKEMSADRVLVAGETFLNSADFKSVSGQVLQTTQDAADKFRQVKAMRRSRAKFFTQITGGDRALAQEKGFRCGMFMLAALKNNKRARAYCEANGIPLMVEASDDQFFALGQSEGIPEDGGILVPPEFENDMIILREMYGVFRSHARISPMTGEVKNRPRRKGGLTAYYVGESNAITESKKAWDQVKLVAKKLAVLTRTSTELSEDAIIDMGDDLAGEIAYAFAKAEDDAGFNGDGTSTYGGIDGARNRLLSVYGTGGGVGLTLGAGDEWADLTLADHEAVVGSLPQYAETPNVRWYCHKVYYATVMLRLMLAAGGVTAAEVAQGAPRRFMGYDVVVSQIMPKADDVSQVPVLFGDLALAADFGDRRATTIAMSSDFHFDTDEIAIRGTERFDINVHDVGNSTDAGPIVGLITAAS